MIYLVIVNAKPIVTERKWYFAAMCPSHAHCAEVGACLLQSTNRPITAINQYKETGKIRTVEVCIHGSIQV